MISYRRRIGYVLCCISVVESLITHGGFNVGRRDDGTCNTFVPFIRTPSFVSRTTQQLQLQQWKYGLCSSMHDEDTIASINEEEDGVTTNNKTRGTVSIIERTSNYIVAIKPPSVVCHHSGWAGLRSKSKKKNKKKDNKKEPEIPMLQRVRDAFGDGKRVNLVHRLDRGASGCLLFTYSETDNSSETDDSNDDDDDDDSSSMEEGRRRKGSTAVLIDAMASKESLKTYIALVRGEGILYGEDLKTKGWFLVDRPIKDESGNLNNATTWFRFVAGQSSSSDDGGGARGSLVLCRPVTGRWHQVRRHLNGLSHPILGDTSHGNSKTNREWKEERNMPGERTCLHLARLQIPPNDAAPHGIDVCCPLPSDMMNMLTDHLPSVLQDAIPILQQEGILLTSNNETHHETGTYSIPNYD